MRETDTIARLGGEEFGALPAEATNLASAAAVAWTIEQTCQPPFVVNHAVVHVSASIGIAMCPEHGTTTAELLHRADAAMYVAKRSGCGHAVFDARQETETARRLGLLADLRRCVERGELVLHYQPKIELQTREITGVEALVRWQHPVLGLLAPDRFLSEVERTELIEPLTRGVLSEALHQQRAWRDQGLDLTIAVNISDHSLRARSNLVETVAELADLWGTPPGYLTLELTEGALIGADAAETLSRLHDMGPRMSIDDYGTGCSSLVHLQRLPVDEIKIDRSFVTGLTAASDDEVIVRSTIELAHSLGLTVVAEGVEDAKVLGMLARHKCDAAQGFHVGRAYPADELTRWLVNSPYRARAVAGSPATTPSASLGRALRSSVGV